MQPKKLSKAVTLAVVSQHEIDAIEEVTPL